MNKLYTEQGNKQIYLNQNHGQYNTFCLRKKMKHFG